MGYSMKHYTHLIGKRQGHLLIVGVDHIKPRAGRFWKCQCDCGRTILLPTSRLASGNAVSCPECGREENRKRSAEQLTTHGLKNKNRRLYRIWHEIISRCFYPGDTVFYHYGGAGVGVAEEWRSYPAFYDWALSNGYRDDLSIDRIDNSKGYYPDNCRWETDKVQAINSKNSVLVTVNGTTMCLADWARAAGVCRQTVYKWRDCGILEKKIMERLPNGYTGRKVLIKRMEVTVYEEAV